MEYTIGEFSKLTGLGIHTLRYYEKESLLTAKRTASNRRRYQTEDLAWAAFIKRLKATGMPIKEIQRYAALRAAGDITIGERMELLLQHRKNLLAQITSMQEHLQQLDEKIAFYHQQIKMIEHPAIQTDDQLNTFQK